MPTYEYACKSCGEHLEVVQSFKDGPMTECPACSGPLRKVFGAIGIAFKGSGFYKTDSRSSTATKRAKDKEASKATAKSDGDSGTKTDTKSDTKPKESSTTSGSSISSGSSAASDGGKTSGGSGTKAAAST